MEASVNTCDGALKNLDFEVQVLPISIREKYREILRKQWEEYNECRRLFFIMEDEVNQEVLKYHNMEMTDDTELGIRRRNLDGVQQV